MDGFSILDPLAWRADHLTDHPTYAIGHALGCLSRSSEKQAGTDHLLAGRLYLAKSGWLLLSVPNALVRGIYDAMTPPGMELPTAGVMNVPNVDGELLNAHISVMTADEVNKIGADKIDERGHMFQYSLGALKELPAKNVAGVSRIWALQVAAPGLVALRKTYGLQPLPNDHPLHITVAVRRTGVLRDNGVAKGNETSAETTDGQSFRNPTSRGELKAAADDITTYECNCSGRCTCPDTCVCKKNGYCGHTSKAAAELSRAGKNDLLPGGKADNVPDQEFSLDALAQGKKHEHEHTDNDQVAEEIAKDHLSEDPRYYEKVRKIEKAGNDSVYAQQFKNLMNFRQPIVYDHNKPVYQNVVDHLRKAQERADFILASRQREHIYRTQLDPRYRYQMAQMAIHGTLPRMNPTDKAMQLYGNDIFDSVSGLIGKGGKKNGQ